MTGEMFPAAVLALAALLSLDATALGQWMFSRPLVCAPLVGACMGHPEVGLWVGLLAELLWVDVTPVGVGIPYDVTAVAVLGTLFSILLGKPIGAAVMGGLLLAVPFGFFFRRVDAWVRHANTWLMHGVEQGVRRGKQWALPLGVSAGLAVFWLAWFATYAVSWLVVKGVLDVFLADWIRMNAPVVGTAFVLLPVAALGVALEFFMVEPGEPWWAARRLPRKIR